MDAKKVRLKKCPFCGGPNKLEATEGALEQMTADAVRIKNKLDKAVEGLNYYASPVNYDKQADANIFEDNGKIAQEILQSLGEGK